MLHIQLVTNDCSKNYFNKLTAILSCQIQRNLEAGMLQLQGGDPFMTLNVRQMNTAHHKMKDVRFRLRKKQQQEDKILKLLHTIHVLTRQIRLRKPLLVKSSTTTFTNYSHFHNFQSFWK